MNVQPGLSLHLKHMFEDMIFHVVSQIFIPTWGNGIIKHIGKYKNVYSLEFLL